MHRIVAEVRRVTDGATAGDATPARPLGATQAAQPATGGGALRRKIPLPS
jgi:hypothetical protein